jgi:hypothetical protein
MRVFGRLVVNFLGAFIVLVADGGELFSSFESFGENFFDKDIFLLCSTHSLANKTRGYSSRYINDFNSTSAFEPIYDYDNTKTEIDKVPLKQTPTKADDNLEIIYPDPDEFHRKLLNKSRMENRHHDDTVIKICELSEKRC